MQNKGFSSILMLVAAIIILVLALVLYGYFNTGGDNIINNTFNYGKGSDTSMEEAENVSEYDDVETLEAELNATTVDTDDGDFAELEEDLQSL